MTNVTFEALSKEARSWYSKVYGGWLGKSIGGTLGMPYEGEMRVLDVRDYDTTLSLPAANDDLDLQLVNLHALEYYGPRVQAVQLGREWLEHVFFPFDEYGYALANLRRGLLPPLAGWFNNPFIDCMGAPIRSELWAMLVPGQPEIAAYYAWQDAQVDHAGGEGMYGEMFFAAIECQAFLESDREQLIACGLQYLPEHCQVAQAVRHTLACHRAGKTWQETRASILAHFGHKNFTDAPQNVAFTLVGWLYGADFGEAVRIAINCGYDTDCTGATLGAILGIIAGHSGIPEQWSKPIGNQIVVSDPIRYLDAPRTLEELTERTLCVAYETQAFWQNERLGAPLRTRLQEALHTFSPALIQPQQANGILFDDTLAVSIAFQDHHPAIASGQTKTILTTLTNRQDQVWKGLLELQLPEGWSGPTAMAIDLAPQSTQTYAPQVTSSASVHPAYTVSLSLTRSYQGALWSPLHFPIALVPANHWSYTTQNQSLSVQSISAGNSLLLPAQFAAYAGQIQARTILENPSDRMVRLIVVAQAPVEVWLDQQHLFTTRASRTSLPTFHRPESGSFCECFLSAGRHDFTLLFSNDVNDQTLEPIIVLPVSASGIDEPGPYYYLTDLLFLPPCASS